MTYPRAACVVDGPVKARGRTVAAMAPRSSGPRHITVGHRMPGTTGARAERDITMMPGPRRRVRVPGAERHRSSGSPDRQRTGHGSRRLQDAAGDAGLRPPCRPA